MKTKKFTHFNLCLRAVFFTSFLALAITLQAQSGFSQGSQSFTQKIDISNIGNGDGTYYLLLCKITSNTTSKMTGAITIESAAQDSCFICGCEIELNILSDPLSGDSRYAINNLCDDGVSSRLLIVQYAREEYIAVELIGLTDISDISFTGYADNKSLLLVNENQVTIIDESIGAGTRAGDPWTTSGNDIYKTVTGGNVGIGTITPTSKLHINSGASKDAAILATSTENNKLIIRSEKTQPAYCTTFRLQHEFGNDRNNGFIDFYRGGSTSGGFLTFGTNGIERLRITRVGNVGIGTDDPVHKLVVAGTIGAREVIVDANMGADFVFSPSYPLRPLSEVEQFITANNHLPDIDPADTMIQNGVNMGEMQMQLLQKIEELTLYVIEQGKKIEMQQQRIEELEKFNQ